MYTCAFDSVEPRPRGAIGDMAGVQELGGISLNSLQVAVFCTEHNRIPSVVWYIGDSKTGNSQLLGSRRNTDIASIQCIGCYSYFIKWLRVNRLPLYILNRVIGSIHRTVGSIRYYIWLLWYVVETFLLCTTNWHVSTVTIGVWSVWYHRIASCIPCHWLSWYGTCIWLLVDGSRIATVRSSDARLHVLIPQETGCTALFCGRPRIAAVRHLLARVVAAAIARIGSEA